MRSVLVLLSLDSNDNKGNKLKYNREERKDKEDGFK
jgi:hypothetical protein